MNNQKRSFFWPILLIGAGIVLLLANLNVVPLPSLAFLFRLWPVLLIVVGIDVLVGRRLPWISGLVGLAVVAALIALAIFAPALGLAAAPQARAGQFSEPVGEAASARVTLHLTSAPATVHPLPSDSSDLIFADLIYVGEIQFDVRAGAQKSISLGQQADFAFDWANPFSLSPEVRWGIGLTTAIPLDLTVDGGSGTANLDLDGLKLSGLNLDVGSGAFRVALPQETGPYVAHIEGGSGRAEVQLPAGAHVELVVDGGSGAITLDVPAGPLRVDVRDSGSGAVHLPPGLRQVRGGDDSEEGVWETDDYGTAARRVTITIDDAGSGNIEVR